MSAEDSEQLSGHGEFQESSGSCGKPKLVIHARVVLRLSMCFGVIHCNRIKFKPQATST